MKRGLSFLVFFVITLILFTILVSAQENETNQQQTQTIKCYSSKDCPQPASQSWCDDSSACQELAKCSNPETPQSECSIEKECVNCINIGYLGCKDGQCQKINCYKDSDCGESFTKKYCTGSQACIYENIYFCQNPGTIDSYCDVKKTAASCTPCTYGCQNNACQESVQPVTPSQPACSDTDGGIDYYVKGSLMFEGKIVATDSCEDGTTLREESCTLDPSYGTMSTNIYKCPNGCKDGACIKGEKQKEEVKCIFKNTKTEQKCYRAEYNWMYCSGIGTCIVTNLEGYDGEKITWKSSCGSYAYTVLDGNNEYAEFDCSGMSNNFCQSAQCEDGSWTKCYVDGSGYCACTACQGIIIKPVCGNKVCETGEGTFCNIEMASCEAGKECKAKTAECKIICPEDCKTSIEGINAKLNEKFKLQISQPVKITDYKSIKIIFRDLITSQCEGATTTSQEVKAKITAAAISETATSSEAAPALTSDGNSVEIIKCPEVGPMAQLEIANPEIMPGEEGNKILTLKLNEAKNIYDVSVSFLGYDWASKTGWFIVNGQPISCPEHCKCDSEGYVLECRTEEKCEEGKRLCPDGICREECEAGNSTEECSYGCFYGDKCLPIGVRVSGLYCSITGDLLSQLQEDTGCENNFECDSNVCVVGKCISKGLIKKVINWFSRLFGGG